MSVVDLERQARPEAATGRLKSEQFTVAIESVAPTVLDHTIAVRREPTRPPDARGNGFDDEFDNETLFYDAFFSPAGSHVITVGPPFLNLRPLIERMRVVALPAGTACQFFVKELDRHAQLWIRVPPGTRRLAISSELGSCIMAPRPNLAAYFEGRRVLMTLSRNNRPEWIQDWIRYNRDVHGADAVLLYDNGSTRYEVGALADAIKGVAGIKAACVVQWPFKYGPQGNSAGNFWDSDFCQNGALEHARWCFLHAARSVMNSDIDELVISRAGNSIFAAVEGSPFGILRYYGAWMPSIVDISPIATNLRPIRHRDFDHVLLPRRVRGFGFLTVTEDRCPPKWAVVPRGCPPKSQWAAHNVKRWMAALPITGTFSYRHFREINDNWKYDRSSRVALNRARHTVDEMLTENFARVSWET